MKATYGVSGMMEWVALIPMRRNIVRVRFKGGSLSGYGVTPATFTTTNPVVMRMIEESGYYRSGKIRLISKENDAHGNLPPAGAAELKIEPGNTVIKKERR